MRFRCPSLIQHLQPVFEAHAQQRHPKQNLIPPTAAAVPISASHPGIVAAKQRDWLSIIYENGSLSMKEVRGRGKEETPHIKALTRH